MNEKMIGATLLHIVCCGLILAITLGGVGFLTKNWWFFIIAAILLVTSLYFLLTKRK